MRASLFLLAVLVSACGTAGRSYVPGPGTVEGELSAVVVTSDRAQIRGGRADAPEASAPDRQLIRNASIGLEVGSDAEVAQAVESAVALADAMGGYTASQSTRGAVLRIPDEQLNEALEALSSLGKETRRDVTAVDVTAQYTDLQIRLDNARALRDRLAALLQEASGVEDVLAVERELARVTTEVERLEGQMRLLQNQVAFSTVRLDVREGSQPGPLGYVVIGVYEAVKWLFVWD